MKKLKILFISHTSRTAGAESCLVTLARCLDREQFEPVVVLPVDGVLRGELEAAGVRTIVSALEWWVRPPRVYGLAGSDIRRRVDALVKIMETERPDVVHSNTSVIWEGALAAAFAGIPHVWHLHEILAGHPSLKTLFPLPVVYSLVDLLSERVVTVSEAVKSKAAGLIDPRKISVVHNGVKSPPLHPGIESELREELGIPRDTAIAVSIGALIPEKGYDALLDAAALVQQKAKVAFVIVGKGEVVAVKHLVASIDKKGLAGLLHHLGYRSDICRILAGADLLVLSSTSEAFPLVVLEAMAAGKPVVATDCGGPREMVAPGETGFLVPVGDCVALADGILRVVTDATLGARMGAKARDRFAGEFTEESFALRFASIYRELARTGAKTKPEGKERIFLEGMMHTYQRLADYAFVKGVGVELVDVLRRMAAIPLRPVQRIIDWKKRNRR